MEKKRLVILGGGPAGLPLARKIEKNKRMSPLLNVVLVDRKAYYELTEASPRFLVDPKEHSKYTRPYSAYLTTTRFVCGEVRTIYTDPKHVEIVTQNGPEFLPYDYLVICMGTRYQYFKSEAPTLEARTAQVLAFSQQVAHAETILIVGGRSVGVEVMGEIFEFFPASKRVIIVHSSPTSLMDGWVPGGIKKLSDYVQGHGKRIDRILGLKVVRSEGNRHELSDGSVIEADMRINATGMTPNTEPLRPHLESAISPGGYVKVRRTLQLENCENIFAFGDIADLDHPKMAANIHAQLDIVLDNLQTLVLGKLGKLKSLGAPYLQHPGIVTLGPSQGILAMPWFGGTSMSGKFISSYKSNMFAKIMKDM